MVSSRQFAIWPASSSTSTRLTPPWLRSLRSPSGASLRVEPPASPSSSAGRHVPPFRPAIWPSISTRSSIAPGPGRASRPSGQKAAFTSRRWPRPTAGPRFADAALGRGITTSLSLPLRAGDEVFGALNLYGEDAGGFAGYERVAEVVAQQASVTLANARDFQPRRRPSRKPRPRPRASRHHRPSQGHHHRPVECDLRRSLRCPPPGLATREPQAPRHRPRSRRAPRFQTRRGSHPLAPIPVGVAKTVAVSATTTGCGDRKSHRNADPVAAADRPTPVSGMVAAMQNVARVRAERPRQ